MFCEKPAAGNGTQTDKANATALYAMDKNVRAIDNNYYTVTKEAEARVHSRKTDKARHAPPRHMQLLGNESW